MGGSRRISSALSVRIQRFIHDYNKQSAKHVRENDIKIFREIPESLKILMHVEIYMPFVEAHPMMGQFKDLNTQAYVRICHCAFSERKVLPHQEAFMNGDEAKEVVIVVNGKMLYTSKVSAEVKDVPRSTWLAE